jgi:hypothetical protein
MLQLPPHELVVAPGTALYFPAGHSV